MAFRPASLTISSGRHAIEPVHHTRRRSRATVDERRPRHGGFHLDRFLECPTLRARLRAPAERAGSRGGWRGRRSDRGGLQPGHGHVRDDRLHERAQDRAPAALCWRMEKCSSPVGSTRNRRSSPARRSTIRRPARSPPRAAWPWPGQAIPRRCSSDGRVLIAGDPPLTGEPFTEIYDPATGTFTRGPNMVEGRRELTATTLMNGDILFTGGIYSTTLATAELYDVPSVRRRCREKRRAIRGDLRQ